MTPILPAIIPTSSKHLRETAASLRFAPRLQIDIVDGVFAAPASWPYNSDTVDMAAAQWVCEHFEVQVDIMALNPATVIADWAAAGVRGVVVHIETVAALDEVIDLCAKHQLRLWLSGNDTVPVSTYLKYQDSIHGVQLMGVETIGQQGQSLSARVLDNITRLKAAAPNVRILIDGSVNADTIMSLKAAGANEFVVGSAIIKAPDPRASYQALRELVN